MWRKKCKHTTYKFHADISADPIWCKECDDNLDIDDFPLSEELKEALLDWIYEYKTVLELDDSREFLEGHNLRGEELFRKVKDELGAAFPIVFVRAN